MTCQHTQDYQYTVLVGARVILFFSGKKLSFIKIIIRYDKAHILQSWTHQQSIFTSGPNIFWSNQRQTDIFNQFNPSSETQQKHLDRAGPQQGHADFTGRVIYDIH